MDFSSVAPQPATAILAFSGAPDRWTGELTLRSAAGVGVRTVTAPSRAGALRALLRILRAAAGSGTVVTVLEVREDGRPVSLPAAAAWLPLGPETALLRKFLTPPPPEAGPAGGVPLSGSPAVTRSAARNRAAADLQGVRKFFTVLPPGARVRLRWFSARLDEEFSRDGAVAAVERELVVVKTDDGWVTAVPYGALRAYERLPSA